MKLRWPDVYYLWGGREGVSHIYFAGGGDLYIKYKYFGAGKEKKNCEAGLFVGFHYREISLTGYFF